MYRSSLKLAHSSFPNSCRMNVSAFFSIAVVSILLPKSLIRLQIWISPERVGEKTGSLAFIGISRPYFAITNKTRVQGSKITDQVQISTF